MTTKGQIKPTCRLSLTVSQAGQKSSSFLNDENFKITLQILQVLTPKFQSLSKSVLSLFEGWHQVLSNGKITAAKIGHHILPESEKLKSDNQATNSFWVVLGPMDII